jgi:excisionase family DNA binding protein
MKSESKLLGAIDVAAQLNLTRRRILQMAASGQLKSMIIGRNTYVFRSEDVEAFQRAREREAA